MNKKAVITICIAAAVVAIGVIVYLVFLNSDYNVYTSAFKKTFNTSSMEFNTSVKATVDSSTVNSTGNFKLKGMNSTPQFINTMTISGNTVTQFSDGSYIYTDDGASKNKIQMGATPQVRNEKDGAAFTYDDYISEFSSLIDASKIKSIGSMEPIEEKYVEKITTSRSGNNRRFEVTLLPAAVDEYVSAFVSENLTNQSMAPDVTAKKVVYTATTDGSGYLTEVSIKLTLDVIAPNDTVTKEVTVDFAIKPVNPGKSVSFNLPSTDGF
jgi:hypothetical protein